MPDGETIFSIDLAIMKATAGVHKPAALSLAEEAFARNEAEIVAIRAEIAEHVAAGKDDLAGRARQRLIPAMAESGRLMNGSSAPRSSYYRARALALEPIHQLGINAIGEILDHAMPGTWPELMAQDRLRNLIAGVNKIAVTFNTWCDRRLIILSMNEEKFRSAVGRHRSRP